MEAKQKTININGAMIPILVNNRALVEYKRELNRSTVLDLEDALRLSYHGLKAGARSMKLNLEMSFEEWIDYTDAHPEIMQAEEVASAGPDDNKKKATT